MACYKNTTAIRTILIVFSAVALSCDQSLKVPENFTPSENVRLLVGGWSYEMVTIEGMEFTQLDSDFEIVTRSEFSPEFVDLNRRHITFNQDHTYFLEWEEDSRFVLGSGPNWQPDFGFWQLTANEDSLIHSPAQRYEVGYKIVELTSEVLVRQSSRIMATTSDAQLWVPGDTVLFIEHLKRRVLN